MIYHENITKHQVSYHAAGFFWKDCKPCPLKVGKLWEHFPDRAKIAPQTGLRANWRGQAQAATLPHDHLIGRCHHWLLGKCWHLQAFVFPTPSMLRACNVLSNLGSVPAFEHGATHIASHWMLLALGFSRQHNQLMQITEFSFAHGLLTAGLWHLFQGWFRHCFVLCFNLFLDLSFVAKGTRLLIRSGPLWAWRCCLRRWSVRHARPTLLAWSLQLQALNILCHLLF